jgi:hypothetical protein
MRTIEVQLEYLLFEILQKVGLDLPRIAQFFNRVVHLVVVVEPQPRRAHKRLPSQSIYFAVFIQDFH